MSYVSQKDILLKQSKKGDTNLQGFGSKSLKASAISNLIKENLDPINRLKLLPPQ
jgi:hypothetical protein